MKNHKQLFTSGLLALGAIVVVSLTPASSSLAHEGHVHEDPAQEGPMSTEVDPESLARPEVEPFILLPSYQCVWRRSSREPTTGGIMATCEDDELPFATGITSEGELSGCALSNLCPVRKGDGVVDGEPLSDDHWHIHGEPIETIDNDPEDISLRRATGSGIHSSSDYHTNEACDSDLKQAVVTLCCKKDFPFDVRGN